MRRAPLLALALTSFCLAGCSLLFNSDDYHDSSEDPCDYDGDGYSAMTAECMGDDCDDLNPRAYPGAPPDCSTPEHENCDADRMTDFRATLWGSSDTTEAGFLPAMLIEGRAADASMDQIAVAANEGVDSLGAGYVMWLEQGIPFAAHFALNDPSTAVVESLADLGFTELTDGISVSACAADSVDVAISVIRRPNGGDPSGHYGKLRVGAMGWAGAFSPIPFEFDSGNETNLFARTGLTDCDIGWPERNNESPRHAFRGEYGAGYTPFVSRLTSLPSPGSDFAFTDADDQPAPIKGEFWTNGGRYAFFSSTDFATIHAWDTRDEPPMTGAPIAQGPKAIQVPEDMGNPPQVRPSLAFVRGSPWVTDQRYLVAIPLHGQTHIRQLECEWALDAGCSISNLSLTFPEEDVIPVLSATSAPFMTAMGTWHTGNDQINPQPQRSGAAVAIAEYNPQNDNVITLYFLRDDGGQIPLYSDLQHQLMGPQGGRVGPTPLDMQIATVNTTAGSTILVASLHVNEENAALRDIRLGGFRICERP